MVGYVGATWANSNAIAYMWRRGKGINVVPYTGNGTAGRQLSHGLSQNPQMIWIKSRTSGASWATYHFGYGGGTNPSHYTIGTNETDAEINAADIWNDTEPTSKFFTIGDSARVNTSGQSYIAMLFASENDINDNPISKCGYYDGVSGTQTITTGFSPKFLLVKCASHTDPWYVVCLLYTSPSPRD